MITRELISTIIWDLDNTLYERNPALHKDLKEAEISVICDHTGWNRELARQEFAKIDGITFKSATAAAAYLSHIPVPQAAYEMETYFDRLKFLKRDEKLIHLFDSLKQFNHYILTNGIIEYSTRAIIKLGLSPSQFKEIVTSEQTGANKPSPEGFLYIMKKAGLLPQNHLMVGDRDSVDIEPAKKLGMQTCFVWGVSEIADMSVQTVYDIETIFA